jgi:hypothetical protein
MGFLGDDDVARYATIEEMSQAVFSASPLGALGGYIILPTKLNSASTVVQCSAVILVCVCYSYGNCSYD